MYTAMPLDPDLPRQRRTVRSGLFYSAASIALALFALGKMPQINAAFDSFDTFVHAHNAQFVYAITHILPFGLVAAASFFGVYRLLGFLSKSSRAA